MTVSGASKRKSKAVNRSSYEGGVPFPLTPVDPDSEATAFIYGPHPFPNAASYTGASAACQARLPLPTLSVHHHRPEWEERVVPNSRRCPGVGRSIQVPSGWVPAAASS